MIKKRAVVRKPILAAMLPAVVLLAGLVSGCGGNGERQEVKHPAVSGVTVAPIALSGVDETYEATGTVRSERTSLVASRAMGVVTSLLVREGDAVWAGQLLLTIDDRDAAERVRSASMAEEAAKQNKALAEVTWQRYKNLYDEKALSRQEMDQVETQKKVAEAEYERARAMAGEARTHQSFTRVQAPVSGRITEKRIEVGSMAGPGIPLLVIEGGGSSYVEAAVDEGLVSKVKTGMPVEVFIANENRPLAGAVREVLPAVDPRSRTFIVKVGLKDYNPRSGLFARIRISLGQREALLVPEQAIVRKGQLTGVYAVDIEGVIAYRLVRTGVAYAGGTEIISGLKPLDRIVTHGVEKAIDGGIIDRAGAGGKAR